MFLKAPTIFLCIPAHMPTILCSTMIHPIDYEAQAIKSNKYMDQQATARSFYFVSYTAQIVEQVNIASM